MKLKIFMIGIAIIVLAFIYDFFNALFPLGYMIPDGFKFPIIILGVIVVVIGLLKK